MLLYYIRHGDPIYSPDSLTPFGERQAEALARRLGTYGLDRIYASSSNRAQLTAKPTCEILKKEAVILDWCNESYAWADFACPDEAGNMQWLFHQDKYRRIFVSEEVRKLGQNWTQAPALQEKHLKEPMERYQRNTDELLKELGYIHDRTNRIYESVRENYDRIALFAHQGFGKLFLSCLLDIPYPEISIYFDFGHSSMTVIDFGTHKGTVIPCVLQLSNDSHIYADGLPTNYQNVIRI